MNRVEALKIAAECIQEAMRPLAFDANIVLNSQDPSPTQKKRAEKYVERAAALMIIEGMLRQKEMHL